MNSEPNASSLDQMSAAEQTRRVTRGVLRLFSDMGRPSLTEFTLKTGHRLDVAAIAKDGKFTAIEVKVSVADFRGDKKWREYLPYCDEFYFAIPVGFPLDLLPANVGVISADAFGAAIIEPAIKGTMNAARRKALTLRFARQAALRVNRLSDTLAEFR